MDRSSNPVTFPRTLGPRYAVVACVFLATSLIAGTAYGGGQDTAGRVNAAPADAPPAPVPPEVITRNRSGQATVRAVKIDAPLRIDGKLDEDVYSAVPPFGDFIQMLPKPGEPATERTDTWVFFDRNTLYISARCWDSAPESEWVANELRRDTSQLRQNDQFGVLFDTFHDRRNGYQFYTNPLGAMADTAITDEANPSSDWNVVWEVRTGRFDGGWTVEMAIPFRSLRYRDETSPVWGIQFRRAIRRKNEWVYLTAVPPSGGGASSGPAGIFRVSAAGTLVGLEVPPASKNIELKPYGISRSTVDRSIDRTAPTNLDGDFGFDAKLGVSSNLTADFTYNTDFAQVEVDEQQVNLTRFSLLFPEKRDFFLEGRGLFDFARTGSVLTGAGASNENTPIMFFSRRIGLTGNRVVPIDVGGRLTGKVGKVGLGLLNIRTGEEATSATKPTDFTVIRVKRDILRRSSVGAMLTNRSVSRVSKGANSLYAADAAFSFYQDVNFSGFVARTETPDLRGDDLSYQARFEYAGDRYGAQLERLVVGEHFNPEVGFLRRVDFGRNFALLRFSPRPRSMPHIRRFSYSGSFESFVNGAGSLESRHQQARFNTEFQNSDQIDVALNVNYELLVRPFIIVPGAAIPPRDYHFTDVSASYQLGAQRRASGTISVQRGGFYNGTISALGYSAARIEVTRRLSLEPGISLNWLELPSGNFARHLVRARTDYAFSPRMFVGGLLQYNEIEHTYSDNLRFRWEYRPGSEVFVVYTDERSTVGRGFPFLQNRAFVIKINRLFQL